MELTRERVIVTQMYIHSGRKHEKNQKSCIRSEFISFRYQTKFFKVLLRGKNSILSSFPNLLHPVRLRISHFLPSPAPDPSIFSPQPLLVNQVLIISFDVLRFFPV